MFRADEGGARLNRLHDVPAPEFDSVPDSIGVHPDGTFVYVASSAAGQLWGFLVHPTTGALSAVPASPCGVPAVEDLHLDPMGRFVYVAGAGGVLTFRVSRSTGALTSSGASPVAGERPVLVRAHSNGRWVYASTRKAGDTSSSIRAYVVDESAGALNPLGGSPYTDAPLAGSTYEAIEIAPDGRRLYWLVGRRMLIFNVDASTGQLSHATSFDHRPFGIDHFAIRPDGIFMYIVGSARTIWTYVIDPSSPNGLVFTPFRPESGGQEMLALAVHPQGNVLYVSTRGPDMITIYRIGSAGALDWAGPEPMMVNRAVALAMAR